MGRVSNDLCHGRIDSAGNQARVAPIICARAGDRPSAYTSGELLHRLVPLYGAQASKAAAARRDKARIGRDPLGRLRFRNNSEFGERENCLLHR